MRQLLHEYAETIVADGCEYIARAYGAERPDGHWEGWIEFVADDGPPLSTDRETTQASGAALGYWASGLEPVYLEGAFARARARQERHAA